MKNTIPKSNIIKKVSIFIPAFNEEDNIIPLTEKIQMAIKNSSKNYDFELIIVNDGSSDQTSLKLNEALLKYEYLKVFTHKKNLGLTQAMRTGFKAVTGEYVLFLPADLESDPVEDIPKLIEGLEGGLDVVTGWRQGRGDGKNFSSKIYNIVSKKLFNVQVHDMNWIKGMRKEVVDELELRSDWHRFIVMMAANKGFKIGEVRTNWYPRNSGESKFGFMRFPIAIIDVLVVKFNMMFGTKPMQFFSFVGILLTLLGFIGLSFLAIYYFLYDTQLRPIFTLSTVLIIAGIQLFVTGFLAELVVAQKDEISEIREVLKKVNSEK